MRVPGTNKLRTRGPAVTQAEPPLNPGESLGLQYSDGEWGERRPPDAPASVVHVPTLMMASLMKRARDTKLPLAATEELEKRLRRDGMHQIARLTQVHEPAPERAPKPGVYHWVRGRVRLCLEDDPDGRNGYEMWLDFDAPIIGRLIEASITGEPERAPAIPRGYRGLPGVPVAPRWAGTHSFASTFAHAAQLAQDKQIYSGQTRIDTRQSMATTELSLLAEAHVLCIAPDQIAVLPEWESPQEAFDYIEDATLPFDPLYLDFSGPGMIAPQVKTASGATVPLYGALVWRHHADVGGEVLMVAPYGHPDKGGIGESPGWFCLGALPKNADTGEVVMCGEVQLFMGGTEMFGVAATCWADAAASTDPAAPLGLPGYALLPTPLKEVKMEAEKEGYEWTEFVVAWSELLWTMTAKVLAALSITEALEVEIVDAPMETRDRKRADKRGWPIAQQVIIRSHSKRYRDMRPPSGQEAHYSHRFWRRATTAHYPLGTRVADTRPDLVTPCKRPLESNCGFCRKVKRPACIVGPEEKPLVLKTLVRRK